MERGNLTIKVKIARLSHKIGDMFRSHRAVEGETMDRDETLKFLHALNNQLNAAILNAFLLRSLHPSLLDHETMEALDSALHAANKMVKEFQAQQVARDSALDRELPRAG
jgi:hypothetical protein